ncbi:MAG: 4-hydroxythreonine-4-phosphate dehydrogenase PdxA [Gammaproteobacteria bacterium HGW-Gammaproteobacteria-8]|nr:MAG: 4-hydroxythreonine-4-phosphate dehydrogenase PdxA [Gammaproteobacteria bacterium HGW-Gammaproteobacteria-8]
MMPLLLTPGEPAGIGPELALQVAAIQPDLVLVADPELLAAAALRLGIDRPIRSWSPGAPLQPDAIHVMPVKLAASVQPGRLDPANAAYVLETLERAWSLVSQGVGAGLVTGPVHKGVINDAGIPFTGHTEFLAERAGVDRVVMLLAAGDLRVALATTHLPLAHVAEAIQATSLLRTLEILHEGLQRRFGIAAPRIAVLGLNPHAGEGGHLGREEIDVIAPVIERARQAGMRLTGPLPADTAFVPSALENFDAVLAMYHDQGLPVLKYAGFGRAVNVTLGLPHVRTSVDHGTALDLAGSGRADPGSLLAAVELARRMTAAK